MPKNVLNLSWLQHGYVGTYWGLVALLFLLGSRGSNHCDVRIRIVTLNSNHTLHQNMQKTILGKHVKINQNMMIIENTNKGYIASL